MKLRKVSEQPFRSSRKPRKKTTHGEALAVAISGSDVVLKSIGKELGKGALAALGGFAVTSIISAISGKQEDEQLKEIGQKLDAISRQLEQIQTSLKELVDLTAQMLDVLKKLLDLEETKRLDELQDIVARIDTDHEAFVANAGNIDINGKLLKPRATLQKNIDELIAKIKGAETKSSLRYDFNRINTILLGTPGRQGMLDVIIEQLREKVHTGKAKLPDAFDQLENFVRWIVWAQIRALRLLVNVEVAERADPKQPTAEETALLKETLERFDLISGRCVAFGETMADKYDQKREFFGDLDRYLLREEPSRGTWTQRASSLMARMDRVRETFLGRTNIVVRLIPHVPHTVMVHARNGSGHDQDLASSFIAGYGNGKVPQPVMRVKVGAKEITAQPVNHVWRFVPSDGYAFQNPPITQGLVFFAYEFDVDDLLPEKGDVAFETGLTGDSAWALPAYRYSALDRGEAPVLPEITGKLSRTGGASVTGMTYATITGASPAMPRFFIRSLEFPNLALTADIKRKRVHLAPSEVNKPNPDQVWMMEPITDSSGQVKFRLYNVGTGCGVTVKPGREKPLELLTRDEIKDRESLTTWLLGTKFATGEHYALQRFDDRDQHISALISDVKPPRKGRRRRSDFRIGTDEVRTLLPKDLGTVGHLFWKLDVLRGNNVKPWEPIRD